jgi:ketosteroid isomerase-like protein
MSQDDLDRVIGAWKAIGENDLERFIEVVDPDVEFTSLVAEAEAVTYRGHEGVRKWWDSVREAFADFWAEAIDLRYVGDQILAEIRLCGTVQDMKVEQTIWQLLTVKDGLVVAWTIFRTEAEAFQHIARSEREARM